MSNDYKDKDFETGKHQHHHNVKSLEEFLQVIDQNQDPYDDFRPLKRTKFKKRARRKK